jgi:hypothetical protein
MKDRQIKPSAVNAMKVPEPEYNQQSHCEVVLDEILSAAPRVACVAQLLDRGQSRTLERTGKPALIPPHSTLHTQRTSWNVREKFSTSC